MDMADMPRYAQNIDLLVQETHLISQPIVVKGYAAIFSATAQLAILGEPHRFDDEPNGNILIHI